MKGRTIMGKKRTVLVQKDKTKEFAGAADYATRKLVMASKHADQGPGYYSIVLHGGPYDGDEIPVGSRSMANRDARARMRCESSIQAVSLMRRNNHGKMAVAVINRKDVSGANAY